MLCIFVQKFGIPLGSLVVYLLFFSRVCMKIVLDHATNSISKFISLSTFWKLFFFFIINSFAAFPGDHFYLVPSLTFPQHWFTEDSVWTNTDLHHLLGFSISTYISCFKHFSFHILLPFALPSSFPVLALYIFCKSSLVLIRESERARGGSGSKFPGKFKTQWGTFQQPE